MMMLVLEMLVPPSALVSSPVLVAVTVWEQAPKMAVEFEFLATLSAQQTGRYRQVSQ